MVEMAVSKVPDPTFIYCFMNSGRNGWDAYVVGTVIVNESSSTELPSNGRVLSPLTVCT